MKKRNGFLLFSIAMMSLMVVFGAGCGGKAENQTAVESEGSASGTIQFLEKDAQKGIIRGTYDYQGHVIKFEVVRGNENPILARLFEPDAPSHSIDFRLCDDRGWCFVNKAGGHSLTNPDWIKEDANAIPDDEQALKNAAARWALHHDLGLLDQKEFEGLGEEYQSFSDGTNEPPEMWYRPNPPPTSTTQSMLNEETPQKGVLSLAIATAAGTYTQRIELKRKDAVTPLTDHTATYTRVYSAAGSIVNSLITCNHGTCADDSVMTLLCYRVYTSRPLSIPMKVKCNDAAAIPGAAHVYGGTGCCTTVYGLTTGTHVCNDDAHLQMAMMQAGAPLTGVYCGDSFPQVKSFGCF